MWYEMIKCNFTDIKFVELKNYIYYNRKYSLDGKTFLNDKIYIMNGKKFINNKLLYNKLL